jgi:hypothetical protein
MFGRKECLMSSVYILHCIFYTLLPTVSEDIVICSGMYVYIYYLHLWTVLHFIN